MVEKTNLPNEKDPVKEQDQKNEDDEFKRIEDEKRWYDEQILKVRNLNQPS